MAPPEVPVVAGDELLVKVPAVTAKVPWLKMAPPPCWPLLASPLLSVSEFEGQAATAGHVEDAEGRHARGARSGDGGPVRPGW